MTIDPKSMVSAFHAITEVSRMLSDAVYNGRDYKITMQAHDDGRNTVVIEIGQAGIIGSTSPDLSCQKTGSIPSSNIS